MPPLGLNSGRQQVRLLAPQVPLQHWWFFLHFFPVGLHSSSAAATPPSDPSVPPTRAAPINLSALPREMLPLASPLVSSSKECPLASGDISSLLPQRAGLGEAPPRYITPPR